MHTDTMTLDELDRFLFDAGLAPEGVEYYENGKYPSLWVVAERPLDSIPWQPTRDIAQALDAADKLFKNKVLKVSFETARPNEAYLAVVGKERTQAWGQTRAEALCRALAKAVKK